MVVLCSSTEDARNKGPLEEDAERAHAADRAEAAGPFTARPVTPDRRDSCATAMIGSTVESRRRLGRGCGIPLSHGRVSQQHERPAALFLSVGAAQIILRLYVLLSGKPNTYGANSPDGHHARVGLPCGTVGDTEREVSSGSAVARDSHRRTRYIFLRDVKKQEHQPEIVL